MSTRISKDLGYYASLKQVKKLFKPDYREIMESLEDDGFEYTFKQGVFEMMKNHQTLSGAPDAKVEQSMFFYPLHNKDYDWEPANLIRMVFNMDSYHGVLIQTPELIKKRHFDDDIDYYENPSMRFKAQHIQRSIYPRSGFLYKQPLADAKAQDILEKYHDHELVPGMVIDGHILSTVMYIVHQKSLDGAKFYKALAATGSFHPNVDPLAYIIAKVSGILRDDIDEMLFRTTVQPAILTTWG